MAGLTNIYNQGVARAIRSAPSDWDEPHRLATWTVQPSGEVGRRNNLRSGFSRWPAQDSVCAQTIEFSAVQPFAGTVLATVSLDRVIESPQKRGLTSGTIHWRHMFGTRIE